MFRQTKWSRKKIRLKIRLNIKARIKLLIKQMKVKTTELRSMFHLRLNQRREVVTAATKARRGLFFFDDVAFEFTLEQEQVVSFWGGASPYLFLLKKHEQNRSCLLAVVRVWIQTKLILSQMRTTLPSASFFVFSSLNSSFDVEKDRTDIPEHAHDAPPKRSNLQSLSCGRGRAGALSNFRK